MKDDLKIQDDIIKFNGFQCPICLKIYNSESEARRCFFNCKNTVFNFFEIYIKVDLVKGVFVYGVEERKKYFKDRNAFSDYINKIDVFFSYDHIVFSAYSTNTNDNKSTLNKLKQYFINWCMQKVEDMKKSLEKTKD